ncbi:hypothetical protein C1H46_009590 [Malus baccata]|uniref:Uncharacterized protein n=1 Tax=Malus baccata TaxID=106549 RepID=A0A540N0Z6_MALBA|nr:hypothetical protein C1H46_009590 [Malus baccata]
MGASTSAPFHRESVLQHHDPGTSAHPMRSHWWARTGQHGTQPRLSFLEPSDFAQHGKQPQSSFLDPPNFMRQPSDNYYRNFSKRSFKEQEQEEELDQEQEQQLDWKNYHSLSRTRYMEEKTAVEDEKVVNNKEQTSVSSFDLSSSQGKKKSGGEGKEQDHYALLGLSHLRSFATEEQLPSSVGAESHLRSSAVYKAIRNVIVRIIS